MARKIVEDNGEDVKVVNKKANEYLNRQSNFKVYELILFAVLIIMATCFLTVVVEHQLKHNSNETVTSNNNSKASLEEFEEVYDLINSSYYIDVDKDKLIEGAINGMLSSLNDPHTSYFIKEETDNFNQIMEGSYKGIGAEISINSEGQIIVVSVFKNSPALEEGLKFGDVIKSVNGTSTNNMTPTDVVTLIKDDKTPTANVIAIRDGQEYEFNITKRIIEIESVESKIFSSNGKKIGYVSINTFANNTYEQFRVHVEDLESKNISRLIIDVRGNSGGYLHSVTNMLDMFLPKGAVTYQIADKEKTHKYTAPTNESRNYPIAVLVDKSSASASEIMAIGLKESYGAEIIGTSTYGKGTVQVTKDLSNGSMIKYTIQKWLSPKGNWVNDVGVEPTIMVELSEEYENNPCDETDNQLQKAIEVVSKK